MDGGQVALSTDGEYQLNAWMNREDGGKHLFFAHLKVGEAPAVGSLVKLEGQQSHPVLVSIDDNALIAFEHDGSIGFVLLDKDGKVIKQETLKERGRYPRLVHTKAAVYVTWETNDGVKLYRIDQSWWKPEK